MYIDKYKSAVSVFYPSDYSIFNKFYKNYKQWIDYPLNSEEYI